jgi:hypothetical protein
VTRVLALLALAGCALVVGVAPAGATGECRGLQVCVSVAGPWVLVPSTQRVPRTRVEYQMSCPPRFVVGGLDAELSDRAIDVGFLGKTGSPVNPGITTARAVVFVATYVGTTRGTPSFRPRIGCIPASGSGVRVPTSLGAVFPPGQPTERRVRTVVLAPGRARHVVQRCASGERLVDGTHAVGFTGPVPPSARQAAAVTATRALSPDRVAVAVRVASTLHGARAVVQVSAVCAGGQ